jgi:hypothetical protein
MNYPTFAFDDPDSVKEVKEEENHENHDSKVIDRLK